MIEIFFILHYDDCPPQGRPRRIRNKQFKKPCPPYEAEGFIDITISWFGVNHRFMSVSQSQNIKNRIFFCGLVYVQLNAKMPYVQVV